MARMKTQAEFDAEVFALRGFEYVFLEDYQGADKKIKVVHMNCGHEYKVRPYKFLGGGGCPQCARNGSGIGKTTEEVRREIHELVGTEYELIGEYVNARTKITIKHEDCGEEFETKTGNFKRLQKCPKCKKEKCTIGNGTEFETQVNELGHGEYQLVGNFHNMDTRVKILHKECGKEFSVKPRDFIAGKMCGVCKTSRGEANIKEYLDMQKIKYEREKEFDGLVNERPLRFDFYLPDYNLLIEFDGVQHFEHVPYFTTYQGFVQQQKNDEMKNNYCVETNIPLLRIPYTELGNEGTIIQEYIEKLEGKQVEIKRTPVVEWIVGENSDNKEKKVETKRPARRKSLTQKGMELKEKEYELKLKELELYKREVELYRAKYEKGIEEEHTFRG